MSGSPEDGKEGAGKVPAVGRAVAVLADLAAHGPAPLAALSRRVGIPKSTLLGICQALVEERLLQQDEHGRYTLGLALAELASAQMRNPPGIRLLGVAVPDTANPFYAVELRTLRHQCDLTGIDMVAMDAGQDARTQAGQVGELVRTGVDAIVLDAVHSAHVRGAVRAARDAGIPVIAVNAGAEGADACVTTDNVQAGQLAGQYLAGLLDGPAEIAIIDGRPVTATADRVAGFMSVLREHPAIRVVARERGDHTPTPAPSSPRNSSTATPAGGLLRHQRPHLGRHPRSPGSPRPIPARGERGRLGRRHHGHRHRRPLKATAAQDPARLAHLALRLAGRMRAGEPLTTRVRLLPTTLITAANADDYHPWG
ncbi:substrate-binding domain-containing protein [Nonomuraea antimicrobica]